MKRFIATIMIVSLVSISLTGCSSQPIDKENTTQQSRETEKSASLSENKPVIEYESLEKTSEPEYGYFEVAVNIKNISDEPITLTGVSIDELNASGNVIDSYMSYNKNAVDIYLEPGQTGSINLTESDSDGIAGIRVIEYEYEDLKGIKKDGKLEQPVSFFLE